MRLLVVYPYFVDQSAAGHSLMFETLCGMARMGHEVTVVSGESGYMQGQPVSAKPWYRRIVYTEQMGPIRVLRTLSYTGHQKGMISRLLSYALLSALSPVAVLMARKADLALLSPPPLYPIFTSLLACWLRRIPAVTEVRDLWPGSIVQMGLMNNPWLVRVTSWMERVVYDQSHQIIALTQGIAADIVSRGWPARKVHILPCAVDTGRLAPDREAGEAVRSAHGWAGKFVLMYFGAVGEANNLPVILRTAQRLKSRPDIVLAVVGDGFRRKWLVEQVMLHQLGNLKVLPAVPKAQAAAYLNAADACVVTLQDIPVFAGAIPTKLIEYMACGRPVLCGVKGEARRIVEEAGGGFYFDPDDDAQLAMLTCELLEAPAKALQLGQQGRRYVQTNFDSAVRQGRMAALLEEVLRHA
ncbi:MAG: glycosyltransferase family 4 protein [Ramlibacter sp.]|nr:glycosyltransferase family 4 protein [Ramlibacter sp.]